MPLWDLIIEQIKLLNAQIVDFMEHGSFYLWHSDLIQMILFLLLKGSLLRESITKLSL